MKCASTTPILTTDDRVLCCTCYQEDDTAELEMWYPPDPENYPVDCDNCGLIMTGENLR